MDLEEAVRLLGVFFETPLTEAIGSLERALAGADADAVEVVVRQANVTPALLAASVAVRQGHGRISDLIHAVGISLALPELLRDREVVVSRPSLGPGNDPNRPFDVQTDQRVMEFKFSVWNGRDSGRKKELFKDYVNLAFDDSGRRPELYVLGSRPGRFLQTTSTSAEKCLLGAQVRAKFQERHGDLGVPISEFAAAHPVDVIDLTRELPDGFLAS